MTAAITGKTPDGEPIKGDYKFTDEFPMADGFEENVAFFELRYLDADDVDLGLAFDDIAPLLWLRAGGQGPIATTRRRRRACRSPYVWTDRYGVLFDEDRWRSFVSARPETAHDRLHRHRTRRPRSRGSPPSCPTVDGHGPPVRHVPVDVPARARARLMRYELRDYQRDAALEVLKRLRRGRRDWREAATRSSFALSAITGSGKTVIATAVIEALLFGSTDLDTDADPRIIVPVDHGRSGAQPADRGRMLDASELLTPEHARRGRRVVPRTPTSRPGSVYFLNTQKLSQIEPAGPERHERPRVLVLGHPRATRSAATDRPRPGARRGAPGHEARGRPPDDRAAPHPRRAGLQSRRSRSSGASRPRSSGSRARWAR